jgi:hypothetical protein
LAYLDRTSRNWGRLVATVLGVPVATVGFCIETVTGSLACEGVDGPCGPTIVRLVGGILIVALIAAGCESLINRIIKRARIRQENTADPEAAFCFPTKTGHPADA